MHKVLQFTLVFILSSILLANSGLNQTTTTKNKIDDTITPQEQLQSFVESQDEETQSRILSLQILAKESIAMLNKHEGEPESLDLMKSELHNLLQAIDNLPTSTSLFYELSYLEDNLKMIQSELSLQESQEHLNIKELNCQEVSNALMRENSIVLFNDQSNGGIRTTANMTRSAGETILHIKVQMKNKDARDIIGGLEKNTLMIFEDVNGNTIKCTNKERTYGQWDESSLTHEYFALFALPSNCHYSSITDKVKLIWSNGLHVYSIADQTAINELFACICKKS